MEDTLKNLYQAIGQALADALPEKWSSARLDVAFEPRVITTQGHYQPAQNKPECSFHAPPEVVPLFNELHTYVATSTNADWQRATFTLQSDGQFDVAFEY